MNIRKVLALVALSIGCSTVYAQSQGFVRSLLNGAGVGNLGKAFSGGQRTVNPEQNGESPVQTSSAIALPTPESQQSDARGYMLNDGVSAQTACNRVVLPSQPIPPKFAKFANLSSPSNVYTQAQCLQDMTAAAPEIDETRKSRQAAAQAATATLYPSLVERAVQTSLTAGSTDSACDNAVRDIKSVPDEKRDDVATQCEKDMRPIYYQRVRAPGFKPLNCNQWAIRQGEAWRSAPVSMQYRPLAKSTGPAQFSGEIRNAEDTRLTVINGYFPAYVDVDPSTTMVFDSDKIQVGSVTSGYGVISGKEEVELTTGARMTIPVFRAACID